MPLKGGFEYIVCITIYVIGKDIGQYFPNIFSGDKDFANKHIRNTNTRRVYTCVFANSHL